MDLTDKKIENEYLNIKNDKKYLYDVILNIMKRYNKHCGNYCFASIDNPNDNRLLDKQINYYGIFKNEDIKDVLEIGVNAGHSILISLLSNPNINIICNDIMWFDYTKECLDYISGSFNKDIKLYEQPSTSFLESLEDKVFDLIHIDGDHRYESVYSDILMCKKFSSAETILVVDDVEHESLRAVNDLIENGVIYKSEKYILRNMDNWPHGIFHYK